MNAIEWIGEVEAKAASQPLWHPDEGALYWACQSSGKLFRFFPETGKTQTVLDDSRPIGAMTLQEDGSILLFRDQANIVSFRDGEVVSTVIGSIADFRLTRFASAAADSMGRVVCSVYSDSRHPARLLLLGCNGRLSVLEDSFGLPGGMAFSPGGDLFYFNDAHQTRLSTWVYPYDASLANPLEKGKRLFYDCHGDAPALRGAPAGIAAMEDGSVLVARHGGSSFVLHDASSEIKENVKMPVYRPSFPVFAGDALSDLYVTTSGSHRKGAEGRHAGQLCRITGYGKGAGLFRSKISLPGGPSSCTGERAEAGAQ